MGGVPPTPREGFIDAVHMMHDLAEPLEREAIIERVGRVAAESIGADLGFVGLLDGPDLLRLGHVYGARTSALETVAVERGRGLGGKVLSLGLPGAVRDYMAADSITHEYDKPIKREGLAGVLCLPLAAGDELLGVAYVSDRVPTDYSDVMVDRVLTAVESAKLALSVADRSRELTEAAVEVERARTLEALDANVGLQLQAILESASAIVDDPTASPELAERARNIVTNAGAASAFLAGGQPRLAGEGVPNAAGARVKPSSFGLTAREHEVLCLAALGLSNPEIGERLYLARGTIKAYMESIFRKLPARNRVEAVMIAAREGLLDEI